MATGVNTAKSELRSLGAASGSGVVSDQAEKLRGPVALRKVDDD